MAGCADHECLALFAEHERRPYGLVGARWTEPGEVANLVHTHPGRFLTQLAPSAHQPGDQLFARVGDRFGKLVDKDGIPVAYQRDPAEPSMMRCIPRRCAKVAGEISPALAIRFGSSNVTDTRLSLCDAVTWKVPLLHWVPLRVFNYARAVVKWVLTSQIVRLPSPWDVLIPMGKQACDG